MTDCLAWLQDLQRALRRDNDGYRPIGLLLGQWKVVKTKLLPLVMSCRYDRGIVLTVLKILVILTKPLRLVHTSFVFISCDGTISCDSMC